VNEAVNQIRKVGKQSAAGMVNAVLRRAAREGMPALPAADVDPREHARTALSHPSELFDRLVELLGSTSDALKFCKHDNAPPPTILRLGSGVALRDLDAPDDVKLTPHEQSGMIVMQPTRAGLLREWSRRGLAQAQDPTSAAVVPQLDAQPGELVLDRCCGLGTKTLQIVEQIGHTGRVVAIDPSPARTNTLRMLLADRGITMVQVVQASWMRGLPSELRGPFDRVLIDAPCSNSGVLARRSAARFAQDEKTLASLIELQMQILDDTADHVRCGGMLVYSTCSVWPEENEQIVRRFVQEHTEFSVAHSESTLPSSDNDPAHYHDGGYYAVLRRT
jgi:16S rRNA (cytosine967-C5)-methyltransferase